MGKYAPLAEYLRALPGGQHDVEVAFDLIDRLVGGLPPSARTRRQWRANNSQPHALAWRDAGWHVERPYFDRGTVQFARGERGGSFADRGRGACLTAQPATAASSLPSSVPLPASVNVRREWFWEGNVQSVVASRLLGAGWSITSVADTAAGGRGVDVVACRAGRTLLVEVKGFPSTAYARGERMGQQKRTRPVLQAKHWYADVLLKTVRLRHAHPEAAVAIALPAHDEYGRLVTETAWALESLAIHVLVIDADGAVQGLESLN